MILAELQRYLDERGRASVAELETRFDISPAALRGMLDRLAARGRVRRLPTPSKCVGCQLCPPEELELYACGSAGGAVEPAGAAGCSAAGAG